MCGSFVASCGGGEGDSQGNKSLPLVVRRAAALEEALDRSRREHAVILLEGIEALRHLIDQIKSDPGAADLFRDSLKALTSHLGVLSEAFGEVLSTLNEGRLKITD